MPPAPRAPLGFLCATVGAGRWQSYQYTHGSLTHIGMNVLLTLVAGIPLEGFYGPIRLCILFNVGVIFGGLFHMVYSAHTIQLVGMSAGCYALLGVHMGDLFLNWSQIRFRKPKLFCLLVLIGLDILNIELTQGKGTTSYPAHLGGYILGLSLGIVIGRNLQIRLYEVAVQVFMALACLGLLIFALVWIAQWPPRTLKDLTPWCWARQIASPSIFRDMQYHCARCGSQDCINYVTNKSLAIYSVDWDLCGSTYGWGFSG